MKACTGTKSTRIEDRDICDDCGGPKHHAAEDQWSDTLLTFLVVAVCTVLCLILIGCGLIRHPPPELDCAIHPEHCVQASPSPALCPDGQRWVWEAGGTEGFCEPIAKPSPSPPICPDGYHLHYFSTDPLAAMCVPDAEPSPTPKPSPRPSVPPPTPRPSPRPSLPPPFGVADAEVQTIPALAPRTVPPDTIVNLRCVPKDAQGRELRAYGAPFQFIVNSAPGLPGKGNQLGLNRDFTMVKNGYLMRIHFTPNACKASTLKACKMAIYCVIDPEYKVTSDSLWLTVTAP